MSLDTTTRAGSCAVRLSDGRVDEQVGNPELTHAQRLPNDLAALLARHQLTLDDVTLYAIASGPGSFTGLRVGIATMQALALVHDRLIVPISTLEAIAETARAHVEPGAWIGAWMDAYRGEVFAALYRIDSNTTFEPIVEPAVGTPEEIADAWTAALATRTPPRPSSLVIVGDAIDAQRALLQTRFPEAQLRAAVPIAGVVAELAARDPARAITPHALVPQYLRRPLAELTRERVLQR